MRKKLEKRLSQTADVRWIVGICNSFDVIGDIAIVKLIDASKTQAKIAAEAIMKCNKGIRTVLAQTSKISGEYRLRNLTCIGGEDKTYTVHKEHGCFFTVDLKKCCFSPRLSGERLRIAQLVKAQETVINMFAGVGCFSIIIARRIPTAKVFSIDINPDAVGLMQKNIRINRVFGKVIPMVGDSKLIVDITLQTPLIEF